MGATDDGAFQNRFQWLLLRPTPAQVYWTPGADPAPAPHLEATMMAQRHIEHIVDAWVSTKQPPGMGIALLRDGSLLTTLTRGMADVARSQPVTSPTVFRIGSITKTMTALAVMQLWEQGRVDLDAPVDQYLRSYRVAHPDPEMPPITLRHLLTHTAGLGMLRSWRDLFSTHGRLGVPLGQPLPSLPDYYGGLLRAQAAPGAYWSYANHGFATLGQVVEDVSGEPYAGYLHAHVFTPLGMQHSDVLRGAGVAEQLAVGYGWGTRPVRDLEIVPSGAGSVFASLADMARYAEALLNGGANEQGRVVQGATLERMLRPHYQLHPRLPGMGLGFILDRLGDEPLAWHNGGWPGFFSLLLLAPRAGAGVVLLTNRLVADGSAEVLGRRIMRVLLDLPEEAPSHDVVDAATARRLAGFYVPDTDPLTRRLMLVSSGGYEIVRWEDRLELRTLLGPFRRGVPLRPVEPGLFRFAHEGQTMLVAVDDVTGDRADGLCVDLLRYRRRPAWRNPRRWLPLALLGALTAAGLPLARRLWRWVRA